MPRQRSPSRDKAFNIYKEHKGNIKLKDIAKQLNISDVQIRKWKSSDKWDEKLKGTLPLKSNVTNKNKCAKKEPMQQEVEEVLNNSELTDKQRLFCIYQVKYFNATKSYQKAYESSYESALVAGPRLLGNVRIKEEIQKLKQSRLNRAILDPDDIFQKYMDIAFSDITDYIEFGQKKIKVKDNEGKEKTIKRNYVDFNSSNEVDGTIISEVSQGKDGVKIKLNDKMKALDWLAEHMNMATEEQRLKCEKLKADIKNANGNSNDSNDEGIKNFIEATRLSKDEIKELFEDDENEKEKED
ncbi:terminase small subunit [Clostridium felsineum]|uniref:terminase small subunit n=1 Tax=Clostridium felsineum TaxID=36839 RepID=UPI00214D2F46|nr:terminase small subunit [Clostridium felsineum]MCR3760409.1 terminase small subunit [Clostridium felsineum]